jgi:hypothetical protein
MSDSLGTQTRGVFTKLDELRRALRRITGLVGLNWTLCAVVGFVLVTLAFDYGLSAAGFRVRVSYRAVPAGACALAVLIVAWRYLISPLRVKLTEDDLALRVERHFPQLKDRLISAVQFTHGESRLREGVSRELVRAVVAEAGEVSRPIDFTQPLDRGSAGKKWIAGGFAAAVLATLVIAAPELMAAWFQRNVLFQSVKYPGDLSGPQYALVVEVGSQGEGSYRNISATEFGVLAGYKFDIVVRTRPLEEGRSYDPPDEIGIDVEGEPDSAAVGAGDDGEFAYSFERPVVGSFTFKVSDPEGRADPVLCRVKIEAAATLKEWTLTAVPPAYTRSPPRVYDHRDRDIAVASGGTLLLAGKTDRALKQVRAHVRRTDGGQAASRTIPASVKGEPAFSVEIPADEPGPVKLSLSLTDDFGYRAEDVIRDLDVRVLPPDERPRVMLARPGTGDKVTPQVVFRFELRAVDDFGLLDKDNAGRPGTYLNFRFRGLAGDSETPTLEYTGGLLHRAEIPNLPGLGDRVHTEFPPADPKLYPGGKFRWYFQPVDHAKIQPGDKLDIWAVCKDTYRRHLPAEVFSAAGYPSTVDVPAGRPAEECRSEIVRVTVVEPGELLEVLVKRQREQYRALRGLLERQEDVNTAMSRWMDELRRPGVKAEAKLLETLAARARTQESIGTQLSRIADVLEGVTAEMECNRLGKVEDRRRLQDAVVLPLRGLASGVYRVREQVAADPWTPAAEKTRLASEVLPALEQRLGKGALIPDIASELDDLAGRPRPVKDLLEETWKVYQRQRLAAKVIEEVMKQMQIGIHSSLDEVIRLLKERVIKPQQDVLRDTEQKLKDKALGIFNDP